ncbi:PilC/PilY family type IV pilus protein [Acinetobacter higginsii]|uniref:PilC/PilY family type IV pilus protein n=1 Tax=Acinetobacter higginsii TaxID=70347 RepID=UPI0026772DE7|nr:PilC/PilY family type IV pilus protein [Acinetobacter higginsii]MDO3664268.1 PilC/PilY family type IV pilus protein [Acinetobacter higginsii]
MKIMKLKKIVVACQAAVITMVTSVAVSTQASDVELYKAPQKSKTTIMFMIDVSGSMTDKDGGTVSRIDSVKTGMTKLLQGDAAANPAIAPLADNLIIGLSEFSSPNRNGPFGRMKLEARPLGEVSILSASSPVFKTVESFTVPENRTITETRTWGAVNQTRTQTGTRLRNCRTTDGTSTGGTRWCNVSTVSSWQPTDANTGWSTNLNTGSSGGGTWTSNNPGWNGGSSSSTGVASTECTAWQFSAPYNCTTWATTTKTASNFGTVTSTLDTSTTNYGAVSDGSRSAQVDGAPVLGSAVNNNDASCTSNAADCQRTQKRSAQVTSIRTYTQSRTGSYTVTTTYYGVVTQTHRQKMQRAVDALVANGGTPTGYAFAEVAAYMMGQSTAGVASAGSASGFVPNNGDISGATNYTKPSAINEDTNQREFTVDSSKQCNTQGIYFLTDGAPTYYDSDGNNVRDQYKKSVLEAFMKKSLGTKAASFSCGNDSTLGKYTNNYSSSSNMPRPNGWDCIGAYTKALLEPTLNPAGVKIKTAVVGFGNEFSNKSTSDEKDADGWGNLGEGGSYTGRDSTAVVASVLAFLKKLQKYIAPVTTGSVTIPVDNLDTQNIQPWGYFPQFDPAPNAKVTTWVGNLKKYQVVDNVLKDQDNANVMIASGTKKGESVDNPNDFWADQNITKVITKIEKVNNIDTEVDYTVRVGGALSRLLLGSATTTGTNPVTLERAIFTDRRISLANDNATYVANPIDKGDLLKISTADFKSNNPANNFSYDARRGYLAALFGYDVTKAMASGLTQASNTAFNNFLIQSNATLRQMGAVMHSKPILITQKGTTQYDEKTETISYVDRDDLIAFGTTQGLLHVVRAGKSATDSDAGKEVFVFVPNEMVDRQAQATGFLTQESQDPTLRYGIDGQWTAYTEYATKAGEKTNEPVVSVASANGGKQWLYGGLRMGGKSYYSLDLSDVTSAGGTPKLKFRINPTGACSASNGIGCMGQSWSKPSIAWVNWQGKRKLVMFVGGGYDTNYENSADYVPSSGNIDEGAGVYMFDANDGSLLWWASANAGSSNTSTNKTYAADMKRSVVSSIKTVDNNSDGLVDHLYFGDLGGQVWRVDLNGSTKAGVETDGENFAIRTVRILDMSGATKPPRFYNTPAFTIHSVPSGGLFAAVSIGSGNLSYPMSATTNDDDGVYVVYDKDVIRRNLPVLVDSELYTKDVKPSGVSGNNLVKNTNGATETKLSNGGWYYPLGTKKRILNDSVAIDSDLYVSIFDSSKDINDVDCYGGVRGESNSKLFCLPYGDGNCKPADNGPGSGPGGGADENFLGKGNVGISFGGINRDRSMVLNLTPDKTPRKYTGKTKFVSQRWYER